ncbi:selenocysteine lyase [Catenovulum agarivorans DS-2]|uniref:Selenocysteine lyase n=2 Tax=Catenovulum agarivorans TaxID=1172192 RepID=W7R3T0_9ALTE|nr:selenocysteine lyase [Catenovulum agarivorans DS-2]
MKLGTTDNLPFDEQDKQDHNLVAGCESSVWLTVKPPHLIANIRATSDSKIVRGLLVIILYELNQIGIDQFNLSDCLSKYKLANHLSESRTNGLSQVFQQIKANLAS